MKNNINYLNILKKLNNKAKSNNDIPVSCLIIKNDKIISKSYNKRVKNNDPFQHAEINAIRIACKKLNSYNLSECILVSTLKPCKMCEEIIKEAKIKKVYYYLDKEKIINNKIEYVKIDDIDNYFKKEIKNFFQDKR